MATSRPRVIFGFIGVERDRGLAEDRWSRWRPTVSLGMHPELGATRIELFYQSHFERLAKQVAADIQSITDGVEVLLHLLPIHDPWDFEEVYGALHDWSRTYPFVPEREDYLVHLATGTHVIQICMFLLTESRRIPARLLQTSPKRPDDDPGPKTRGSVLVIDLDLSRYDALASRFRHERHEGVASLKAGIETRNAAFNEMMARIEIVAAHSTAPLLLTGPTGAGKSQLASRIHELRRRRHAVVGEFVDVNCATLRGDQAMSTLFGHVKGAFTGALTAREGLLRRAHGGTLFLDEIGELGLDEQAMLLRALEDHTFYPVGSDAPVSVSFQLLAGTNRDLVARVAEGKFRDDLLARLQVWSFRLPGLAERREDLEPNLDYELDRVGTLLGVRVQFNREARASFLAFGMTAPWRGNFRDLSSAVLRMATMARGGRIDRANVDEEIERLSASWGTAPATATTLSSGDLVVELLGAKKAAALDRFDRVQLADVLAVCRASDSLSDAGRTLFAMSRTQKVMANDASRLRKYLARFELSWQDIHP